MLWQIFIGHGSASFPLLSACRLAEFDSSVICHVSIVLLWLISIARYSFKTDLLNLHEFPLEGQNMKFTVDMLLT